MSAIINVKLVRGLSDRIDFLSSEQHAKTTQNLHWQKFAKVKDMTDVTSSYVEVPIEDFTMTTGQSDTFMASDNLQTFSFQLKAANASAELVISRKDMLRNKVAAEMAASWARQAGSAIARWNEKLVIETLLSSTELAGWDNLSTFHAAHLVHPKKPAGSTFSNLNTDVPINGADLAVASANLDKACARMSVIPTSNGETCARIRPKYLVVPPALKTRAMQLTASGYISATDFSPVRSSQELEVLVLPELSATFAGGSDSVYYLLAEESVGDFGAFMIGEADPLAIVNMQADATDSELDARREFVWRVRGDIGCRAGDIRLISKNS